MEEEVEMISHMDIRMDTHMDTLMEEILILMVIHVANKLNFKVSIYILLQMLWEV